jgi:hypothetical protein
MFLRVCRRLCSLLGPGGGFGVGHGGVLLFTSDSGYFWEHLSATGGALLSNHCGCSAAKKRCDGVAQFLFTAGDGMREKGPEFQRAVRDDKVSLHQPPYSLRQYVALRPACMRAPQLWLPVLPCFRAPDPSGLNTPADLQQLLAGLTFLLSDNTSHHLCPPAPRPRVPSLTPTGSPPLLLQVAPSPDTAPPTQKIQRIPTQCLPPQRCCPAREPN